MSRAGSGPPAPINHGKPARAPISLLCILAVLLAILLGRQAPSLLLFGIWGLLGAGSALLVKISIKWWLDTQAELDESPERHILISRPRQRERPANRQLPVEGASPTVKRTVELITKSFVRNWHSRISSSEHFPMAFQSTVYHAISETRSRCKQVDLPNILVAKIMPKVTTHLRQYRETKHLIEPLIGLETDDESLKSQSDSMPLLRKHLAPGYLHPALCLPAGSSTDLTPSIESHVRGRVKSVLSALLPAEEKTELGMLIATEILTCTVLVPLLQMLSDPDFWNQTIERQGEKYLQERHQVNQLRAALDTVSAGDRGQPSRSSDTPTTTSARTRSRAHTLVISAGTDQRTFEKFLKAINKVRSLTEAKRLGNDIDREIRSVQYRLDVLRTKPGLDTKNKEDGEKALRDHLERLTKARSKVDAVIKRLTGASPVVSTFLTSAEPPDRIAPNAGSKLKRTDNRGVQVSLRDILSNPSSLGYWMEFADRKGQSRLVQFWVTVEAFRNPLEDEGAADMSNVFAESDTNTSIDYGTLSEDLTMLWNLFLNPELARKAVGVNSKHLEAIQEAIGSPNDRHLLLVGRRHALQAQSDIYYWMLDEMFESFESTELFQKVLADSEGRAASLVSPVHRSGENDIRSNHRDRPPQSSRGRSVPSFLKNQHRWLPFGHSSASVPSVAQSEASVRPANERESPRALHLSASVPSLQKSRSRSTSASSADSPLLTKNPAPLEILMEGEDTGLFQDGEGSGLLSPHLLTELEQSPEDNDKLEAIQSALSEIIAKDDTSRGTPASWNKRGDLLRQANSGLSRLSPPKKGQDPLGADFDGDEGAIRNLALVSQNTRRKGASRAIATMSRQTSSSRVFDDDNEVTDDGDGSETGDVEVPAEVPETLAPGDLELTSEIGRLGDKILKLQDQDNLLERLIHMAELSGKDGEVRLLTRSQKDLKRELRALKFRKLQYEQRDFDNRIVPGKTQLKIPNATILDEEAGKQIIRYVIEVQQTSSITGDVEESWAVARRYSEFDDLHHALKRDPTIRSIIRDVELPSKRLVPILSDSFVESRRRALEHYIQSLAQYKEVCDSPILRNFLSTSSIPLGRKRRSKRRRLSSLRKKLNPTEKQPKVNPDPDDTHMVQTLYRQVAASLDDIFLKPSMLDVVTERLTKQAAGMVEVWDNSLVNLGQMGLELGSMYLGNSVLGPTGTKEIAVSSASTAVSRVTTTTETERQSVHVTPPETTPRPDYDPRRSSNQGASIPEETVRNFFVAPICDLLVEALDLQETGWLRKQAIVVIMQQFLGSTIERKVRDTVTTATSAGAIDAYFELFQKSMWPDGENRRPSSAPRTTLERKRTREAASRTLHLLISDLAGNMVSKAQSRTCSDLLFNVLQFRLMNQHLVLTIFDEVLGAVFPSTKETPRLESQAQLSSSGTRSHKNPAHGAFQIRGPADTSSNSTDPRLANSRRRSDGPIDHIG